MRKHNTDRKKDKTTILLTVILIVGLSLLLYPTVSDFWNSFHQTRAVADLSHPKKYGFIISNPPYGERLEDKETIKPIYRTLGERFAALDSWSMYIITSDEEAESYIGRKADKDRKIYNGMMKTRFYSFMGPKPPRQ